MILENIREEWKYLSGWDQRKQIALGQADQRKHIRAYFIKNIKLERRDQRRVEQSGVDQGVREDVY